MTTYNASPPTWKTTLRNSSFTVHGNICNFGVIWWFWSLNNWHPQSGDPARVDWTSDCVRVLSAVLVAPHLHACSVASVVLMTAVFLCSPVMPRSFKVLHITDSLRDLVFPVDGLFPYCCGQLLTGDNKNQNNNLMLLPWTTSCTSLTSLTACVSLVEGFLLFLLLCHRNKRR